MKYGCITVIHAFEVLGIRADGCVRPGIKTSLAFRIATAIQLKREQTLGRPLLLQDDHGTRTDGLNTPHINSMHIPVAGERAQSPAASDVCTKRALWVHPGSSQQEGERRRMQTSNSPAVRRHLPMTAVPVVTAGSEVQSGQDSNP